MRTSALLLLAVAGCISQGPDIPRVNAGNGVTVDSATNTVSIDATKVLVAPTCTEGQVVIRTADGWGCGAGGGANADTVDGKHAADLLGATAQAADSAKLGGQEAAAYLSLDATGNYLATGDLALGSHRAYISYRPQLCIVGRVCGGTISVSGKYCGQTAAVNGALTWSGGGLTASGYMAAKKLCEGVTACATPDNLAHMCSGEEVARSMQIGSGFSGPAWYAPGISADCSGWTVGANTDSGWAATPFNAGPNFTTRTCDTLLPIACCL